MSNYVKATDFAVKDSLTTGDPLKIIKGTELNTEFNLIQTAVGTKADLASPNFLGNPTAVTQPTGNSSNRLATTAFVTQGINASSTNANITGGTITGVALSGLTNDLAVADGGTGKGTLALNNVILGNGTSPVQEVAPGASGNVLVSNGTTWQSTTPALVPSLGVGQTWQNVTSSRAFDTDYTNNTGKPIMLAGSFNRNAVSRAFVDLIIGGVQVPLARNTNSDGGNNSSGSLIIPNNTVYRLVNVSDPLSSYTIFELR